MASGDDQSVFTSRAAHQLEQRALIRSREMICILRRTAALPVWGYFHMPHNRAAAPALSLVVPRSQFPLPDPQRQPRKIPRAPLCICRCERKTERTSTNNAPATMQAGVNNTVCFITPHQEVS